MENRLFNICTHSCKDDQTSADAHEAGKSTGAMSYAFTSKWSWATFCAK
jgi:hypothetical protein